MDKSALTGAGHTKWSYADLQYLINRGGVVKDLTRLLQRIVRGEYADTAARDVATTTRGIPLAKGAGHDPDVRPIGIANVFMSAASGLVATSNEMKEPIREGVGPANLAFGVAGGVEAVHHIIAAHLKAYPNHVVTKMDIRNAFNEVYRRHILALIAEYPLAAGLIATLYGASSKVVFTGGGRVHEKDNVRGVTQGDALSGPLFSTVLKRAVEAALAAAPGTTVVCIADDTHVMGEPAAVAAFITAFQDALAPLGLALQPHKSAVFSPMEQDLTPITALGILAADGIMVAGGPIGTEAYIQSALDEHAAKVQHRLAKVVRTYQTGRLGNTKGLLQRLFRLIRLCIAPAASNHLLRMIPPQKMRRVARGIDVAAYNATLDLLGVPRGVHDPNYHTTEAGTLTARLLGLRPTDGGMGFTSLAATMDAAYVGSLALTGALIKRHLGRAAEAAHGAQPGPPPAIDAAAVLPNLVPHLPLLEKVKGMAGSTCASILDGAVTHVQACITESRAAAALQAALAAAGDNMHAKAGILSGGAEGAMVVIANPAALEKGAYCPRVMTDTRYRMWAIRRLCLPVVSGADPPFPCPLKAGCPGVVTTDGGHADSCKEKEHGSLIAVRRFRHDYVLSVIRCILQKYSNGAVRSVVKPNEPQVATTDSGVPRAGWHRKPDAPTQKCKRADIEVVDVATGESKLYDLVISAPNATRVPATATVPGTAGARAAAEKTAKYMAHWTFPDDAFAPLAFETGGRVERSTRDFLKEHVRKWVSADPIAAWTRDQYKMYTQAMEHMKVTIAIALQKCEADVYLRFSDRVRVLRDQAAVGAA